MISLRCVSVGGIKLALGSGHNPGNALRNQNVVLTSKRRFNAKVAFQLRSTFPRNLVEVDK